MRKFLFIFLFCCFSVGHAQSILPAVERVFAGKILSKTVVEGLSQQSHQLFWTQLVKIPSFITAATAQTADISLLSTPAFQVQISKDALDWYTASGFAIQVNDKVLGLTAAHVAKNISEDPFLKVKTSDGKFVTAPIEKWYIGNRHGLDIAVFEIPEEVKNLVTVLKPSKELLEAGSTVQINGFNRGHSIQIPQENILFSSPQRYLVQHSHPRERTGMCGSPLLNPVTGEVLGMYIGYDSLKDLRNRDWFYQMPNEVQHNFTDLHFAVPIQNAVSIAQAFQAGNARAATIEMKVLGKPVGLLHPDEYIYTVKLIRNGVVLETIYNNVFLNPGKLEEFFELKENDVLSIMVDRPQKTGTPAVEIIYDINVSTGEVTRRENYPRRIF
jgi:hypothetical protein